MSTVKYVFVVFLILLVAPVFPVQAVQSDEQIRKAMIAESISNYPGNCPCPYNRASNGSRCGKRSAWSRPGGASPLCYEADITPEMLNQYKARHRK